jgi:phage-related minor tail protein
MAGNNIKGLTVEIGGDTTKLGKALDNVNKKSGDLSKELGQINKLLKLDPGNAELLAQKQKVLADAVSNTSEKLETLKDAEKQVQEQFKRGEVSEAQVRELQREIIATTKKLDGYEKAAKETAEAIEKLGDGSDDVADGTKKTSKGADDAADSLDDLSEAADKAESSSEGLGAKLGEIAKTGLAAVATAATAAVGALVGSAEATREYRTAMGKLDAAFTANGYSAATATSTYKKLQGVIGETDQSVEAAQQISLLAASEEDAARWAEQAAGVVGQFGDALQPEVFYESANETLKLNEATGAYVQMLEGTGMSVENFNAGLAACTTEAEKQAYMLEITEQALGAAGDRYKEINAEIIRANEANEAWTASLAEVGGAVEPILTDVKMLGASLLSDLLPGIKDVTTAFRGILNGDEGAADALGEALSGLLTNLLNKVVELAPTLVNVAMSLITTLATTLISMLPQLVQTGVQIILSIIQGIASALPQIATAIAAMIPQLVSTLTEAIPQIISAIVSLVSVLAQSLDQILPPLIAALPDLIMSIVTGILDNLPILLDGVIQLVMMLVGYIDDIVEAILPLVPLIIEAICDSLAENIPTLLTAILDLIILLATEVLPKIIAEIVKMIPKIIASILSGLGKILASIASWFGSLIAKIGGWLGNIISQVASWAGNLAAKGAAAAKSLFDSIVNGLKALPGKMKSIAVDLVKGLGNGITDMVGWVKDKIKSFSDSILKGIKGFFGIKSPSRVFRDQIGKNLALGMAEGIEDNADAPLDAMAAMNSDLLNEAESLNGLTLERQLQHSFGSSSAAAQAENSLLGKLDKILTAIEKGQILTIDGEALIGATVDRFDNKLGQRQVLAARGAI